ncbi:MAG: TonB-dependent receptor [Proteobacteria bacterium]|nr:TonB-dependent receptor [Pseudomonadota bacterium]
MYHKSLLIAGASLLALATPAQAQDAAPAAKPADGGLAEIVVTATKREASLQSVPVAVTALTSEAIQNQRIGGFSDLTRAAASLTLTEDRASPNNAIILRGIGTYAFSIGVEPSVAVFVDDVPVVQQAQAFDSLGDVARIEVLRGPQGTLFGKNASAGAINIVTKDPGKKLEINAQGTITTDAGRRIEGAVSGPLSDNVGLRVSGYYDFFEGNVKNLTNGHWLNDHTSYGVRGKLKMRLSDRLTATLNAGYSKQDQAGASYTLRSINLNYTPPGASTPVVPKVFGVPFAPDLVGITPGAGNYKVYIDNDEPTTNQQTSVSGKFDYDLGFAHLLSVTSYQDWKYNFTADVELSDLNVNGSAAPVTSPVGPSIGVNNSGPYHSTEFTQEFRLTSAGSGPLSYVAGAFYANAATNRDFQRGPVLILANWHGYQGTRSLAAFASADYKLPTGTTVSAAVRVNNERVQDFFVSYLPAHNASAAAIAANCGVGAANCAGRNVDTAVTYKVSVRQELMPRVSVYASVASGYKGYAYDISSGYNPLRTAAPVKPERSTSFEVGLKSRFMDNKVQFNLTGFYTDYNNFQAQSAQFVNGALQNKLNNVGKLRTQGFEAELSAKPVQWLRIDGSAAYTDAKVTSFVDAACYSGQLQDQALAGLTGGEGINFCGASSTPGLTGNFQNRSGSQLPNSPKFKYNIGATVEQPVGTNGAKGSITLNYIHQSSVNFDLLGNPLLRQDAYGIVNLSVGLETGAFKITGFINNLGDTHYASLLNDQFGTYGTHTVYQQQSRDSRRYFGLKVAYKY